MSESTPEPRFSIGSDNHSGVHPQIWAALAEVNKGHAPSYGNDPRSEAIVSELEKLFGPKAHAHFVFNGTAANVLCLRGLLQSTESVICAETAHMHLDECGAPEAAIGCKLLTVPTTDGKIRPEQIKKFLIRHGDQHYAQPRVVSLTQPTEYGTVYSLDELREWREFTRKNNLLLHIDGARLIYAAHYLKCSLFDLAGAIEIDALSLGGTKNGLLYGEAVIFFNPLPAKQAKFFRKQFMQLPSKMRFLATQMSELFVKGLWKDITAHSHGVAQYLAQRLGEIPEIKVTQKVQANAVFARIPQAWVKPLRKEVFFYIWDEETFEARLMISFDVQKTDIDYFISLINKVKTNVPL
jgi:threonine aldolase